MSGSKLSASAKEFIPTFLHASSSESAVVSQASAAPATPAAGPASSSPATTRLNPAASMFVPSTLKATAAPFVPSFLAQQMNGKPPGSPLPAPVAAPSPVSPQPHVQVQPVQQQQSSPVKSPVKAPVQEQHADADGEFNFFATPGAMTSPKTVASPAPEAAKKETAAPAQQEQLPTVPATPQPQPQPQLQPQSQATSGARWGKATIASPPPVAAPTPQRTWARGEDVPVVTLKDVFSLADGKTRYLKAGLLDLRPPRASCPPELSRVFPDRLLTFHAPAEGGAGGSGGRRGQKGRGKGRKEEEPPHPDEEKIFGEHREGAYKFRPDAQQDQDESERTKRTAIAILNKLSAGNFDKLSAEFCALPVESKETLDSIVDIILAKAQGEEFFSPVYAELCAVLYNLWVGQDADKGAMFKQSLLEKCQEYYSQDRAAAFKKLEEVPAEDREEQELILKKTYIGHMRFIGELYMKDLIRARHVHGIIEQLLAAGKEQHDEEKMECLSKLLSTVGAFMEQQLENDAKRKGAMSRYFKDIKKLSTDKTFSSRIRFMLQDLIEMRANRWTSRRAKETATTKQQTSKEPAPLPSPARRQRSQDVRSQGPPSRTSTPAPEDEWQTVPNKKGGYARDDHHKRGAAAAAPLASSGGSFQELADQGVEKKRKPKEANGAVPTTPSLESTPSDEVPLADPTTKEEVPPRFRDKGKSVMEEFIVGHDYEELKRSIDEWREPAKLWQVILDAVNMVFEKSEKERHLLASTLVRLHTDGTVHRQQILFALQAILEAYDEMQIDIPKAGEYLGDMMGELIATQTVDMSFIANAPEAFKDSFSACMLIAHTIRGVQARTDETTAMCIYQAADIDAAQFVPFPEPEECAAHVRECFAKVGVSYVLE